MEKIYLIQSLSTKVFKENAKKGFKLKDINCGTAILADKNKKDAIKDCRRWNNEKETRTYFYTELCVY